MEIAFEGNVYRITFAHHNPAKPADKLPKEPQAEADKFTGTRCIISHVAEDQVVESAIAYAYLGTIHYWPHDTTKGLTKRWDQFNRKLGRTISLRRAAKIMFGKVKDEEFVQAYLTARYDYEREKELGY